MSDYISRQAAIEALAGWKISPIVLEPVPTADVRENVRGEWIEKYYASNETGETVFHGMIMCSVCGHVPKVGWLSDFCPNCGADMRGEA